MGNGNTERCVEEDLVATGMVEANLEVAEEGAPVTGHGDTEEGVAG